MPDNAATGCLIFSPWDTKKTPKLWNCPGGWPEYFILTRALINQPDLLILDEPTTGLDPQSRHQVWEKLEALKKTGLTVVIATHYMEEDSDLNDTVKNEFCNETCI
ncbi:MAG: hypothetical protein PVI06_01160 [Desulfobacterales bacterium]|jgi:lipooligosaccharide transport system ATP-binding protein